MPATQVRRVLLQLQADDGDTEEKLDRISAKADELKAKHPELAVKIDTAAASAKLGVLRKELRDVSKAEVKPKIDDAAAAETVVKAKAVGTAAGDAAGKGFAERFRLMTIGIGSLVAVGLAGLPAIAAGAGALAGIALGAKLLIGSSQVKGPLYSQFTGLMQTLMSVIRVAALPLVKPLGEAFAQIGQWAKAMYPELKAVFASVGPLVAPLAKGLEGIVSGVLPGFITLMHAAAPAVSAVGGLLGSLSQTLGSFLSQLAPAVAASSQVLGALGVLVRALMPVVGSLAKALASALAPALRSLSAVVRELSPVLGTVFRALAQLAGAGLNVVFSAVARLLPPVAKFVSVLLAGLAPILPPLTKAVAQIAGAITGLLARALDSVLPPLGRIVATLLDLLAKIIVPYLPTIGALASAWLNVTGALLPLLTPLLNLAGILLQLADKVITPLLGLLSKLAGWLTTVANLASEAVSLLSQIPGIGGLFGGGAAGAPDIAGMMAGGLSLPSAVSSPAAAYNAAVASVGSAFGGWADGATSAAQKTAPKVRQAAANIRLILAQGIMQGLTGSASQVQAAISKLLGAVSTDVSGGYLTTERGSAISRWLESEQGRLVTLAGRRAAILATIAKADAYSANVMTSTESAFGVISAAQSITPALGVGGILRQLFGDVAQIRTFRNNIAKLRRMGLNKAYIDQLIQAGPVQGGQVAAELAAGNEGDIKQVNQAEAQIAQASRSLGMTAAEAMYDSGKQAGKGFLSGLQAQQKQIEQAMKRIADVLVQTIKRELKISSPSQLARELFRQVPAGAVLGIEDGHSAVTAAAARMARAGLAGGGGAAGGTAGRGGPLQLEWVGGPADQLLITLLKNHIRIRGGDPAVLGA